MPGSQGKTRRSGERRIAMENKNAASVPMKIGIASLDAQHEALFECITMFIRLFLK